MRYGPELYRLAVVVIGRDAAADVTQDALLRAWRELPNLRDPERFQAWARRILVNRCRDVVRRRRGVGVVSLDAMTRHPGFARDPAGHVERAADLAAAISRLSLDQRVVVALHYGFDLPIHEVARTLGIPTGTAKSRLNAALVGLRRSLAEPAP